MEQIKLKVSVLHSPSHWNTFILEFNEKVELRNGDRLIINVDNWTVKLERNPDDKEIQDISG